MANSSSSPPVNLFDPTKSGGQKHNLLSALMQSGSHEVGVTGLLASVKGSLREAAERDPLDALAVTVFGGAYLFYLAEHDVNPKVTSYFDALVYISTNLSVGYADIFAKTRVGKAIATAVMTLGPALAAKALDMPGATQSRPLNDESLALQRAILDKLDAILAVMRDNSAKGTEQPG